MNARVERSSVFGLNAIAQKPTDTSPCISHGYLGNRGKYAVLLYAAKLSLEIQFEYTCHAIIIFDDQRMKSNAILYVRAV